MPNLISVRNRRQRTGVKSGEFAEMVGYSRQAFINVENGRKPASVEAAHRIADMLTELGVTTTADDLIASKGKGVPDEPPPQPSRTPKAPPRRNEPKGPKRIKEAA